MEKYQPPVTVPEDVIKFLRSIASRNSFAADMLRVEQRTGGLTEAQLQRVVEIKSALPSA